MKTLIIPYQNRWFERFWMTGYLGKISCSQINLSNILLLLQAIMHVHRLLETFFSFLSVVKFHLYHLCILAHFKNVVVRVWILLIGIFFFDNPFVEFQRLLYKYWFAFLMIKCLWIQKDKQKVKSCSNRRPFRTKCLSATNFNHSSISKA